MESRKPTFEVETHDSVAARSQKEEELAGVLAEVERVPHFIEECSPSSPVIFPQFLIPAQNSLRVGLHQPPQGDERGAGVAAPKPLHGDAASEKFVEDRPAAEERFVEGSDLRREPAHDLACLPPLAPSPFDERPVVSRAGFGLRRPEIVEPEAEEGGKPVEVGLGAHFDPPSSGNSDHLHVWLCDGSGQPTLFVSGLLAVREGQATKAEAEALHRCLLPQVKCEQTMRDCRTYLSTAVHTWPGFDEPVGFGDELEERENEVLGEVEGLFDRYELGDTYEDDDGTLYVRADGWRVVTASLPFQPGPKATATQLRYASAVALAELQSSLPDEWEVDEEFGTEVWVLDEVGDPVLYVTGLLDLREGRLSPRKLKAATERAKSGLPCVPLSGRPAA